MSTQHQDQTQERTYRWPFWFRTLLYTIAFVTIFPVGLYLMYKDQEVRDRPLAVFGVIVLAGLALFAVLTVLSLVGLYH